MWRKYIPGANYRKVIIKYVIICVLVILLAWLFGGIAQLLFCHLIAEDDDVCTLYGYKISLNPDPIQALFGIISIILLFVLWNVLMVLKRLVISKHALKTGHGNEILIKLDEYEEEEDEGGEFIVLDQED